MNKNNLLELAVSAYRKQHYLTAIEYLNQILDEDNGQIMAKLYLGMSYYGANNLLHAQNVFKYLKKQTGDEQVQDKAGFVLDEIQKEIKCGCPGDNELLAVS